MQFIVYNTTIDKKVLDVENSIMFVKKCFVVFLFKNSNQSHLPYSEINNPCKNQGKDY